MIQVISLAVVILLSSSAWGVPLGTALEQEAKLLDAQIVQLESVRAELNGNHKSDLKKLQIEYLKNQTELMDLQSQTQKASDELQSLRNDLSTHEKSQEKVAASWERLFRIWQDKESFYNLHSGTVQTLGWLTFKGDEDHLNFQKKNMILEGLFEYLQSSQVSRELSVNYLDGDSLVSGQVLRWGTLGAQLKESHLPIVPNSDGVLGKNLKETQFGSAGIFLFKDLKKGNLQMQAGLWDRFAFHLPAVFLVVLFAVVFGLFGLFIKE